MFIAQIPLLQPAGAKSCISRPMVFHLPVLRSLVFSPPRQVKEHELSPPLTHLLPHTRSAVFLNPLNLGKDTRHVCYSVFQLFLTCLEHCGDTLWHNSFVHLLDSHSSQWLPANVPQSIIISPQCFVPSGSLSINRPNQGQRRAMLKIPLTAEASSSCSVGTW